MEDEGADIIDIGGESTRPGANSVSVLEECSRVLPIIEGLKAKSEVLISIDTYKSDVARQSIKAGAEMVRDATGFAIGGVPPFGHLTQLRCFVDQNIRLHETVWGAAGTPDTVFALPSDRLVDLSGGEVANFVI